MKDACVAAETPDDVAEEAAAPRRFECDYCGGSFEGAPEGSGLFIWTRGDEIRYEEPPLCEQCAHSIVIGALLKWDFDEEEEG